jgi:hypothetical protein
MKKIFFSLCVCVTVCFLTGNVLAVEGELFASNTVLSTGNITLDATNTRAQTFTAAVDHFTGFYAYLNERVNGSTIVAYLINESSGEIIEESTQRMGSGNGWEEFNFDSPLSKESVYRVKILVPNATGVKWVLSGDVYSGGWYYYGDGPSEYDMTSDMVFQAWGYNNPSDTKPIIDASTPTQAPISSVTADLPNDESDVQETISETPSINVATSINKPTELKAIFNEAVDLSWKASITSDIDGYKIFRSETKGKNYNKIGQVAKTLTVYSDKTVLAGKTYYYIVRAYKDSNQSDSSNEASISVAGNVDIDVATPIDKSVVLAEDSVSNSNNGYIMWVLGFLALAMSALLIIIIKRRRKKETKDNKTAQNQPTKM